MRIENLHLTYIPNLSFYDLQEAIPNITIDNEVLTDDEIIKIEAFAAEVKGETYYKIVLKDKWRSGGDISSERVLSKEYVEKTFMDPTVEFFNKKGVITKKPEKIVLPLSPTKPVTGKTQKIGL